MAITASQLFTAGTPTANPHDPPSPHPEHTLHNPKALSRRQGYTLLAIQFIISALFPTFASTPPLRHFFASHTGLSPTIAQATLLTLHFLREDRNAALCYASLASCCFTIAVCYSTDDYQHVCSRHDYFMLVTYKCAMVSFWIILYFMVTSGGLKFPSYLSMSMLFMVYIAQVVSLFSYGAPFYAHVFFAVLILNLELFLKVFDCFKTL